MTFNGARRRQCANMAEETREGPVDHRSCRPGERTRSGREAYVKGREKTLKIIINIEEVLLRRGR